MHLLEAQESQGKEKSREDAEEMHPVGLRSETLFVVKYENVHV